ncbi:MAG: hypothetical protein OSA98_25325, partial [Rubripirellula sp.]|nr:hypothetical protein [Rubripirellula sp.]
MSSFTRTSCCEYSTDEAKPPQKHPTAMISRRTLTTVLTLVAIMATDGGYSFAQQSNIPTIINLRVMSFNIRNGRANDGDNNWK